MFRTLAAVGTALTLGAVAALSWPQPVKPNELQSDLGALYDGLKSAHIAFYANRTEAEYDALFKRTIARLNKPLSKYDAYLEFQKFAAFGNVAHASVNPPSDLFSQFRANGGKTFPIYLRIHDGITYVGEDYSGSDEIMPGDQILSLNGIDMATWLERTGVYVSADTPYIEHSLLEFRFPSYLWNELGGVDTFDLEIETIAGEQKSVTIDALNRAAQKLNGLGQSNGFMIDSNSRESRLLENGMAYLRPGPFYNFQNPSRSWDNSGFISFIDDAFEDFMAAGADTLIIDLRENPGGDNSFSDHMVAWIADKPFLFASEFLVRSSDEAEAANQARLDGNPDAAAGVSGLFAEKYKSTPRGEVFSFKLPESQPREGEQFEGDVYVLINRHSYSQAVNVAATFQDYGWGTIAGEPTSDFATTYGSTESFRLPNTGLTVIFPKAHIIRPSGDRVPGGVVPEVLIDSPIVPEAEDVVLSELIAHIRK